MRLTERKRFERECRELWAKTASDIAALFNARTLDVPAKWADQVVEDYRKRFDPRNDD